jgi:hypothetical protein
MFFGFIFLTSQHFLSRSFGSDRSGILINHIPAFRYNLFVFLTLSAVEGLFSKKTKRISTTIGAKKQTINTKTNI